MPGQKKQEGSGVIIISQTMIVATQPAPPETNAIIWVIYQIDDKELDWLKMKET